jgi:hypothetical protein
MGYIPVLGIQQSNEVTVALDQHLRILLHCIALSEQCDDLEYAGHLASETVAIWSQMRVLYDAIMEHESLERRMISTEWSLLQQPQQTMFGFKSLSNA